jgi:hypothetical protein
MVIVPGVTTLPKGMAPVNTTTIELRTPEEQPPPRLNRPLPNLLLQGFQLVLRNWPLLLWAYAVNLGFALLAGIPFATGLAPYLDHSLAAQRIAGTVDVSYLGELMMRVRETGLFATVVHTADWLSLLQLLVLFVFFAGGTFVYVSAEPPRLSVLLRGGIAYFWRFLRAALLAGCIAAVLLGILLFARVLLLRRLSPIYVERKIFIYSAISAAVIVLVAAIVRLWWDLVEVYIVRNAMDGERRVRQALLPALRLLGKYFFRTTGSFLLSGVLGVGALALCLFLWKQFVPAHQVWLACLLAQLGLFLQLASRYWQRGIETALVMAADPPIVAVEDISSMVEDELPLAASPEVLAGLSEPTLRELVQKLRTEPWATPEAVSAGAARPSLGLPPAPATDAPKPEDSIMSIFDRHVTKFPLGGVSPPKEPGPAKEAVPLKEAVVEKEKAPENPDRHAIKFPLGGVSPENRPLDKGIPDNGILGNLDKGSLDKGALDKANPEKGTPDPVKNQTAPGDPNAPSRTGKPLP